VVHAAGYLQDIESAMYMSLVDDVFRLPGPLQVRGSLCPQTHTRREGERRRAHSGVTELLAGSSSSEAARVLAPFASATYHAVLHVLSLHSLSLSLSPTPPPLSCLDPSPRRVQR
jgi:hypothetical protein